MFGMWQTVQKSALLTELYLYKMILSGGGQGSPYKAHDLRQSLDPASHLALGWERLCIEICSEKLKGWYLGGLSNMPPGVYS